MPLGKERDNYHLTQLFIAMAKAHPWGEPRSITQPVSPLCQRPSGKATYLCSLSPEPLLPFCPLSVCFPQHLSNRICPFETSVAGFHQFTFLQMFVFIFLLRVSQADLPCSARLHGLSFLIPCHSKWVPGWAAVPSARSARESHTYRKHARSYSAITFTGVCFGSEVKRIWQGKNTQKAVLLEKAWQSQLLEKAEARLWASRKGRKATFFSTWSLRMSR